MTAVLWLEEKQGEYFNFKDTYVMEPDPDGWGSVAVTVGGLNPKTQYRYSVVLTHTIYTTELGVFESPRMIFETLSPPPVIERFELVMLGYERAEILADVSNYPPGAGIYVEFKAGETGSLQTAAMTPRTPLEPEETAYFAAHLTGLLASTEYFYRLVIKEPGRSTTSDWGSFTSLHEAPVITNFSHSAIEPEAAVITANVDHFNESTMTVYVHLWVFENGGYVRAGSGIMRRLENGTFSYRFTGLEPGKRYKYSIAVYDSPPENFGFPALWTESGSGEFQTPPAA